MQVFPIGPGDSIMRQGEDADNWSQQVLEVHISSIMAAVSAAMSPGREEVCKRQLTRRRDTTPSLEVSFRDAIGDEAV